MSELIYTCSCEAYQKRIAELEAAQAQAVPDGFKEFSARLIEFVETAPVASGICCCGESMENHSAYTGHTAVDMWDNAVAQQRKAFNLLLTAAPTPAGSQYSAAISDAIQRGTGFVFNGKHIPYDDVVNPPAANAVQDVRNHA